jgi:hypothetical protein
MEPTRPLAPILVGSGTVSHPRDMIRALETLEIVEYSYVVDEEAISSGNATLVKLLADPDSATMVVNGCLFLNVSSFRYLDFETDEDGLCTVSLHSDGMTLALRSLGEADSDTVARGQMRLLEDAGFDLESFVIGDDEEEDE